MASVIACSMVSLTYNSRSSSPLRAAHSRALRQAFCEASEKSMATITTPGPGKRSEEDLLEGGCAADISERSLGGGYLGGAASHFGQHVFCQELDGLDHLFVRNRSDLNQHQQQIDPCRFVKLRYF